MSEQIASPPEGGQGAAPVSPPAAPPVQSQPPPSPPAAPPPPPAFHSTFEDPELRGYAEVKGFKDAGALLTSYRNLEKLRGVPPERLLTLPEDLSDAAAMAPIREKLGFAPPKEASEYGFATVEGVNPERAKLLEGLALKHGVPKAMATSFFAELAQVEKADIDAADKQYAEEVAVERGKLRAEVGEAKWDAFLEEGKRAGRRFGLSEEDINQLESNLGYAKAMRFLNQVGAAMGEADFAAAEQKNPTFAMSPEAAATRIRDLRNDETWTKRFMDGDVSAKAEWTRLHQIAYPGEVQQ